MKQISTLLFSLFLVPSAIGQVADGFYRVKNVTSDRYLYVTDNEGYARLEGTDLVHDLDAVVLRKGLEHAITDPSSVIFVKRSGSTNIYDLFCQGTSVKEMAGGHSIMVDPKSGYYTVGTKEKGISAYLGDATTNSYQYGRIDTKASEKYNLWNPISVDAKSDNYFAVQPEIEANGSYYASFYASFGFQPSSADMQVFCISKVDEKNGLVCLSELSGIIPNSTPVIISSNSNQVSDNRLDLIYSASKLTEKNKLSGNYFNYDNQFLADGFIPEARPGYEKYYKYSVKHHNSQTKYDPSTMRLLGLSPEGKLAFIKFSAADCPYLPANQAYLKVSSNAPDCFLVLSESEYNASTSIDSIVLDDDSELTFDLLGKRVDKSTKLPAGIYIIGGKKTIIR